MKIKLCHKKYIHIENVEGELYVYADNTKRWKVITLQELNQECFLGNGRFSLKVSSLIEDVFLDKK